MPGAIPDAALTQSEYFWDVNPGQGDANPLLPLDGALDETVESILQSGIPLPAGTGPHTFNLRVQDPEGDWSPLFTTTVHLLVPPTSPGPLPDPALAPSSSTLYLSLGPVAFTPPPALAVPPHPPRPSPLPTRMPIHTSHRPHTFTLP